MSHLDPGTGVTIRTMAASDLDCVIDIASSLPTAPQWNRSAYADAISAGEGPQRVALVADHSGKVIGFAVARVLAPLAELETIAIERDAQGFGFGSSLLLAILEELKIAGVGIVELEVRASNEWPLRIYTRAGFSEVGRRPGYYSAPVEDAVLLRLEFGTAAR